MTSLCHCEAEGRGNLTLFIVRLLRYARNDIVYI